MPHDNDGHIYIDTSVTPRRGVDFVGDVDYVLGVNSGDEATLCTSAAIKPWAKYKPVNYGGRIMTGKVSGSDYWKADGKCGFVIQDFTEFGSPSNSNSFVYKLLAGTLTWTYQRPTGGSNPYRAADFDGYDHNAESPIFPWEGINQLHVNTNGELHMQWDIDTVRQDGELALSDIKVNNVGLNNYYFGAIVWYSNSAYEVKAAATVANGGYDITFESMSGWVGRTVKVVPFFSLNPISQTGSIGTGRFFAFDIAPVTIEIASTPVGYNVNVDTAWNSAGSIVEVDIQVENLESSSRTFGGYIYLYKDGQNIRSVPFSLTVAGNSTGTVSKTLMATYAEYSEYEVYVTGFSETIIIPVDEGNIFPSS